MRLGELPFLMDGERTSPTEISLLIDPSRWLHLNDHRFSGKLFVPATCLLELLAEAAVVFAECERPEGFGFQDVVIERALALDPGVPLGCRLRLLSDDIDGGRRRLGIEIVSDRFAASGKAIGTRRNTIGHVLLGRAGADRRPVRIEGDSYSFDAGDYYKHFYPSHGPLYQSLTGRFMVDPEKKTILGEYDCQEKQSSFFDAARPEFLLSPLGYDSCLQYAVYLARVRTLHGRLPVGGKRIEVLGRHPTSGASFVQATCNRIDEEIMDCDIVCWDGEGRAVMVADDFRVQRSFHHKYGADHFYGTLEANRKSTPPPSLEEFLRHAT